MTNADIHMKNKRSNENCPYVHQNIFSKATIWWMNPIFKKGYKQKLQINDLFSLANKHKAEELTLNLEMRWNSEIKKARELNKKPSFKRAFFWTYLSNFLISGIYGLLWECSRCTGPILIGELSHYFSYPDDVPFWYALLCAIGIAVSSIFSVFLGQLFSLRQQILGWNARTAVVGLMYKKTLKLNNEAFMKSTSGHIVNLSSTDALRYDFAFYFTHHLWIAPLECVIVTYFLWSKIGPSAVVGMSVLFLILIVQTCLGKGFGKLRYKAALATDERVRIMSEIISGMRIIKMYSWEESFRELVNSLRRKEMQKIFYTSLLRSFNYTMTHSTSQILAFGTFMTFISLSGHLTLEAVLVALGLFTVMRVGVGVFFPIAIEKLSEALIALKRTENFLLLPEVFSASAAEEENEKREPKVAFQNYCGSWMKNGKPTLQNITLNVEKGKLIIVVGSVGAGKSSLLSAILKELPILSGNIEIKGKVGYSSQIPWLFADTIRNNILFGKNFDLKRYNEVVKVCALERDFEILSNGDETMIGERGVTLSGGQKARIGLARLAYCCSVDVALLDDPLSAVDPAVAKHLFSECICDYFKNKIRILVTHQLQFLEKADQIVVLKEGEMVDIGTYNELIDKGVDFSSFLEIDKNKESSEDIFSLKTIESKVSFPESHVISRPASTDEDLALQPVDVYIAQDPTLQITPETSLILENLDQETPEKKVADADEEIINESELPSKFWLRSYFDYFNAGVHIFFIIVLLIVMLGNHTLLLLSDWWLANWAERSQEFAQSQSNEELTSEVLQYSSTNSTTTQDMRNYTTNTDFSVIPVLFKEDYYVMWYIVIIVGFLTSMFVRSIMHFYLCVRSSIALHSKMLNSVLKAKIRFFDINPVGNILNRFSKDLGQVDEMLPLVFMDVLFLFGSMVTIIAFVVAINYFILVVVFPMVVYFIWIRRYFVLTSREVKRLEGAYRSPVFGYLSSTLQGLVMIRTFKVEQMFIQHYNHLQDVHSVTWSGFIFASRWLAIRLDILTAIFVSACAFSSLAIVAMSPEEGPVNAGNIGLTLTYSVTLLSVFQWSVRQSAEAENLMTSTDRIRQYHYLPAESNNDGKANPPPNWPDQGAISLKRVSLSYFRGGPKVLKNFTLNIKAKEKIGIVGRTGAGKSSLIAALFRMSDHISGTIKIDDVDTSTIPLHELRKVMAIIPQDPVLFGGTMRKNLDPYSIHSDEKLWDALEQVQLKFVVEKLPLKLETVLTESGSNFSVGQRQLVCLARAILRRNRILVIDEATANVDQRTDQLIQETILKQFSHCTVLTIAHRLNTIISSDRIVVLDNGCLIECDQPHLLLQRRRSMFADMVHMTGDHEEELRKSAKKSYQRKLSQINNLPETLHLQI